MDRIGGQHRTPRVLAACAAIAFVALLGAHRAPATIFDFSDAVGRRAPEVTLRTSDGSALDFEALQGKPTYVFLFSSWCEPCKRAEPFVRGDFAKYGDRVRFVGVDVLDSDDAARSAIAAARFPFAVTIYPIERLDAQIAPDAQLRAGWKYKIPSSFLLDADGIVRFAWHGLAVNDVGEPVDLLPNYLAKLGIH